jgi:hypothetical protein
MEIERTSDNNGQRSPIYYRSEAIGWYGKATLAAKRRSMDLIETWGPGLRMEEKKVYGRSTRGAERTHQKMQCPGPREVSTMQLLTGAFCSSTVAIPL